MMLLIMPAFHWKKNMKYWALLKEIQRQEYLKRHLQKVIPMLMEMEHLKEKVKLNGHFRNLSAFDLDV